LPHSFEADYGVGHVGVVEGIGSQFQTHGNMPVVQIENKLVKA
jgi:hypothetical protein